METVGTGGWSQTISGDALAAPGPKPRILLASSTWWPASARLAAALIRSGCEVCAVCPPGHPLGYLSGIGHLYRIKAIRSRQSLLSAIRDAAPDFIVPCDDRIVFQLHELFELNPELRPLIEHSLGEPAGFKTTSSREELLKCAAELGIRVPRTVGLEAVTDVERCYRQVGPVAVMKLDGTHGGEGVRIVHSPEEAVVGFEALRRSTGFMAMGHRYLIYSDPLSVWAWRRRKQSKVVLQQFIEGTPANNMVACWRGEILGEVSVECLSCQGPTGSANVVRLAQRPELKRVAQLLARKLKISGFFGLDFMIEHASGEAYLIEMNPRCTQLGHLQFPGTGDLAGALSERLTGRRRMPPETPIRDTTIAFFPQASVSDVPRPSRRTAFHDIPTEEPSLVEYLMQPPWPDRRWLTRLYRLARGPKS